MDSLKKHIRFSILIGGCILIFIVGAYLTFKRSAMISEHKQNILDMGVRLNNLLNADPALTDSNVTASAQNLEELNGELQRIREVLERSIPITMSRDGVEVTAAIQQYISEYKRKAGEHSYTDSTGQEQPIQLPDDIAFGFEDYLGESQTLEDSETVSLLDKQRQILSYLLDQLYESKPHSLIAVEREIIEKNVLDRTQEDDFRMDDRVTAKVPGAIDTIGFSLSFTGYTQTLRDFLNRLSLFKLPIFVRDIEVKRATKQDFKPLVQDPLSEIFGSSDDPSDSLNGSESSQKPVISQNVSTFTIEVELVQIILPAN